jgi:hypothetical protein
MGNMKKDRSELAEVLVSMPFGELMSVAIALVEMNQDQEFNRKPETPLGMAQTLYDWAESVIEN